MIAAIYARKNMEQNGVLEPPHRVPLFRSPEFQGQTCLT
jgi:hypothetical protein